MAILCLLRLKSKGYIIDKIKCKKRKEERGKRDMALINNISIEVW